MRLHNVVFMTWHEALGRIVQLDHVLSRVGTTPWTRTESGVPLGGRTRGVAVNGSGRE